MRKILVILSLLLFGAFLDQAAAQLIITPHPNAQALAQRLAGDGVSISNVSFTGNPLMASYFLNRANRTNIGIDSGIVLTTGRAKTFGSAWGVDGNGTTLATSVEASSGWGLPGDADLGTAIGNFSLEDACVLEFDFIPLGDSIKFNYVFSSEEYDINYVCNYNDAFAFFISGPGIPGIKNIALIPSTNTPVSIFNVNNVPGAGCPNNIQFYTDNTTNTFFTHDGHTVVLTAKEKVQPCQTYHLKIVLADAGDDMVDTGVFLEARSLVSNSFGLTNLTQTDPTGNSYLVEGCATGAFNITRPRKDPYPLNIQLSYGGTATNGTDVQALPLNVMIPANDSFVTVNVLPLIDGLPEGIEVLKIFALAGCAAGTPTDSTWIQLRDYDILNLLPDTATICRGESVQLLASAGYSNYQWAPDPTLNSTTIRNPVATPVNSITSYICTATEGTCNARDSVFVQMKKAEFVSKVDVNCRGASTGSLQVNAGAGWVAPVEYSLDGINWQSSNRFTNLIVGNYRVKVRDAGCIDSVAISILQLYPDLLIDNTGTTAASCSGNPDGQVSITASGGLGPYQYSTDGLLYQPANIFNLNQGNFTITVKDANGCINTQAVTIPLNNTVTVDAGSDAFICEGKNYQLTPVSAATGFAWTPAATLSNPAVKNPVATPVISTKYFLTATEGICSQLDSVLINVWPAPVADAGPDFSDCFGKTLQLNGQGGVQYNWRPAALLTGNNSQQPTFKALASTRFYLSVTDARGCVSLQEDDILVTVTPAVRISAGRDTVAAVNQPVQLKATELSTAGVIRYNWSPAVYLNNPSTATPVATLPSDYTYTVTGTTADGCEGTDQVTIKVYKGPEIYIATAFTPDGNGLNDELKAFPVGIKEFRYFRIYNRWGQLVFQTSDPGKGWDGRFNGVRQPTGTFIWMAEATGYNGQLLVRKGTSTLIR